MSKWRKVKKKGKEINSMGPDINNLEVLIAKAAFGLEGGRSQGHTPEEFDQREIMLGLEMEKEHTDDPDVAMGLVMDHLIEFPDYYSKLKGFEASLVKKDAATANDAEPAKWAQTGQNPPVDYLLATQAFDWQRPAEIAKSSKVRVVKRDKARQLVYGVVLVPNEVDIQEDTITAEEIEKTAHSYMAKSRVIGANHERQMDAHVVESYIAPCDLKFKALDGDQVVPKGSWVIAVKVSDPGEWAKVERGDYEGFSVGGEGLRDRII